MKTHYKRNWFWYFLLFILGAGNLYQYSISKWSARQAKLLLEKEQIDCNNRIAIISGQNHIDAIKREAAFYASLLRNDLSRKSWDEALAMTQQIIRETPVTGIEFVLPDGKIRLATNRILEGTDATKDLPGALFSTDGTIHVFQTAEGHLISVPVFENGEYLGRLIIRHSLSNANIAPQ
jgi:hypothetical protein